ncbi:hypothetical protein HZB60_07265 [candidate division KSB1 bacterium]|nr:hypothetical protein [candidate division KSB1 bacterium]
MPDFNPADLPKGTICNTYGDGSHAFYLKKIIYPKIQHYQRRKYPAAGDIPALKAVHSIIHLGGNQWLSCQAPKAKRITLELLPDRRYSFHRYKHIDRFGPVNSPAWAAFDQAVRAIDGTDYDYGQLVDIMLRQVLGFPFLKKLSIFDLGRRQKVCSVACHTILLKAYKASGEGYPGPLGRQYVEDSCPADFAMHDSFEVVHTIGICIP